MSDTTQTTNQETTFNPEALQKKYAEERSKRIRKDGKQQYRKLDGQFSKLMDDPYADPNFTREAKNDEVDVIVVGGGYGGLLSAAELRRAGVKDIRIIERGADIGGTWYWNRYPGAACDVESLVYLPLLEETGVFPKNKYATAPEIWEHTKRIAKKYDLYRDALFQTVVTEATWNDDTQRWTITTDRDDVIQARYLVTSTGPMTHPKLPGIPGLDSYKGHTFHTSRWDYDYTGGDNEGGLTKLADKRIAIIGTGATAIQVVPHLAEGSKELFVFQRTPSSIHIRDDKPWDPEFLKSLKPGWQKERMANFTTAFSGGEVEVDLVNDGWTQSFFDTRDVAEHGDIAPFQLANYRKMDDARLRISNTVENADTAEALKPWYNFFCKRPCFHDEYLPAFNRKNVTLVDTEGHGVEKIDETGIWVGGKHYEVDCIVFSTGFEVGTSFKSRNGFDIKGRDGITLDENWEKGFKSMHGMHINNFPNYFYIGGLQQAGLTANFAHMLTVQSSHLGYIFKELSADCTKTIEVTKEAEDEWVATILEFIEKNKIGAQNQDFQAECTPGYYNNEGKPNETIVQNGPYGGGAMGYVDVLADWRKEGHLKGLSATKTP